MPCWPDFSLLVDWLSSFLRQPRLDGIVATLGFVLSIPPEAALMISGDSWGSGIEVTSVGLAADVDLGLLLVTLQARGLIVFFFVEANLLTESVVGYWLCEHAGAYWFVWWFYVSFVWLITCHVTTLIIQLLIFKQRVELRYLWR